MQELREGLERRLRHIMLDAFGIGFRGFGGHAQGLQDIHDQPVPRPHAGRELLSFFGQKYPAVGAAGREPAAFEARDGLDGSRMRDAKPARDIGRTRLAVGGKQVVDQFDIVFEQRARLRRTRFAEAARLRELGR